MNTNFKTTIHLLVGAIVLGACSSPPGDASVGASAPRSALVSPSDPAGAKAASDVLFHVRDVVATGRVNKIGFSSPAELDDATLGDAIPVYYVSSQEIAARTPGADPHAVFGKPQEMLYPILVNGVVKSQVKMGQTPSGEWVVTGVGGPETIQAIDETVRALAIGGHAPAVALVRVHDLHVSLLAHEETGEVTFTPFAEKSAAGFALGASIPAETAFARIAELARQTMGRAR